MKKIAKLTLIVLLVTTTFACKNSVELVKRHYTGGYYIATNKHKENTKSQSIAHSPSDVKLKPIETPTLTALGEDKPTKNIDLSTNSDKTNQTTLSSKTKDTKRSKLISPEFEGLKLNHAKNSVEGRKSTLQEIRTNKANSKKSTDGDVMLVLLVILAILIPPLAVYLKENSISKWFWITLILCLFSIFFGFGPFYSIGLLWLVAAIIALLKVFDKI